MAMVVPLHCSTRLPCECCERRLAAVEVIDFTDGESFLVCELCAEVVSPPQQVTA